MYLQRKIIHKYFFHSRRIGLRQHPASKVFPFTKSTGVDFLPIIIPLHNALLTGLPALVLESVAMTQSLHR